MARPDTARGRRRVDHEARGADMITASGLVGPHPRGADDDSVDHCDDGVPRCGCKPQF